MKRLMLLASLLTTLSGCSSIIEGSTQGIIVNSVPDGASCTLTREGLVIGAIPATPATIFVKKDRNDITVICEKQGYEKVTTLNESDVAAAAFGNIIAGGLIGITIDMMTGAQNKYDSPVTVVLGKNLQSSAFDHQPSPGAPAPNRETIARENQLAQKFEATGQFLDITPPQPEPKVTSLLNMPMAEPWRIDRAINHFRVLHRLAAEGLMPRVQYDQWARSNVGVFLLTTRPPPLSSASAPVPPYEDLAAYLGAKGRTELHVADVERRALIELLAPNDGRRDSAARPPIAGEPLNRWIQMLRALAKEGFFSPEDAETEIRAIEAARRQSGLIQSSMDE